MSRDSRGHFYKKFGGYCGKCGQGDTTLNIGPMREAAGYTTVNGFCAYCAAPLVLEHGDMQPRRALRGNREAEAIDVGSVESE